MSNRTQKPNWDSLEALSTEELYAVLQQDDQNFGVVMAASRLLDERETEPVPSVDDAWASFQRDYLPLAEQGETLCDAAPAPRKKRRILPRIAGVAAALILVFCAGFLIPIASGSSAWHTFVLWTKDAFGLSAAGTTETAAIPPELQTLKQLLGDHEAEQPQIFPQWLPEGYVEAETRSNVREDTSVFFTMLQKTPDDCIMLFYRLTDTPDGGSIFEKDENPPEEYVVHGVTHFILCNDHRYTAVWQRGDLECSIQSVCDRADLIRMIDSIYGE